MKLIQSWLMANKLTLNIKKTKFMLIGSPYRLHVSQVHNDFTVQVNNKLLERVSEHKTLGVHILYKNVLPGAHTLMMLQTKYLLALQSY